MRALGFGLTREALQAVSRLRWAFAMSVTGAVVAACSGVNTPEASVDTGIDATAGAGSSGGGSGAGSSGGVVGGGSSGAGGGSSSSGSSSSGAGGDGAAPTPVPVGCGAMTCASGEACCGVAVVRDAGRVVTFSCAANQTSCPAAATSIVACTSSQNCASGLVCCRLASAGTTSQTCQVSCVTGEVQLCASDPECLGGRRCVIPAVAADAAAPTTGVCMPPVGDGGADGGGIRPDGGRRDAGAG